MQHFLFSRKNMPALCVSMQGVRHFSFWLATLSPAACHSCCCPSECVGVRVCVWGQVSFLWSALCWDLRRTCHLMQNIAKFVFVQLARYLHNLIIYLLCCLPASLSLFLSVCVRERECFIIKTWQRKLPNAYGNEEKPKCWERERANFNNSQWYVKY